MSSLVKIAKIAPSASIVYQFLVFFVQLSATYLNYFIILCLIHINVPTCPCTIVNMGPEENGTIACDFFHDNILCSVIFLENALPHGTGSEHHHVYAQRRLAQHYVMGWAWVADASDTNSELLAKRWDLWSLKVATCKFSDTWSLITLKLTWI